MTDNGDQDKIRAYAKEVFDEMFSWDQQTWVVATSRVNAYVEELGYTVTAYNMSASSGYIELQLRPKMLAFFVTIPMPKLSSNPERIADGRSSQDRRRGTERRTGAHHGNYH